MTASTPKIGSSDGQKQQIALRETIARIFNGCYQVERPLNDSARSNTFLGVEAATSKPVVIKTLLEHETSAGMRMRLEHEAALLQKLDCPWLAPMIDVGWDGNTLFLVMRYVAGHSLATRLQHGRLSLTETMAVGRSLLSALKALQRHRIVHRDIKPKNIIINSLESFAEATLVDFGQARNADSDSLQEAGAVESALYLSPEQAGSIDADVAEASDLYAAGVVLFHCLVGGLPFEGDNVGDILFKHMTSPVPELRSLVPEIPRALDELIQRLLRKDPRDRYQTADSALMDFQAIYQALEKGELDPHIVVGVHDHRGALTEPAFVGREKEISQLNQLISQTQKGRGGLVLLAAESGGGKSRLLSEVSRCGAREGLWCLRGQGTSEVGRRPYCLLDGVSDAFLSAAKIDEGLVETVKKKLGADQDALVAALPQLKGVFGTQNDESSIPEEFAEARSLRALGKFLDSLGSKERPALIILDDCQWADESTYKLIQRWQAKNLESDRNHHVLLMIAFREEEVSQEHVLRKLKPISEIQLSPFEPHELRRLAESMAGPLPDEAAELIVQLAEGSPFMASAVLRGFVEHGALVTKSGQWEIEPLAMANLQSSTEAATFLARRIELLPEQTIELLSIGAVLGKEFDLHMAALLANQASSQVFTSLDAARQRHLLWVKSDESQCVFVHDRIRSTLLHRLTDSERKEIHYSAAFYLQKQSWARASDLAYHFDAAGDSKSALPYALRAAEQARSQHSLEIAEQQYRIAVRGAGSVDKETRYRAAEGLGDILMLRGQYDNAAQLFETAVSLAEGEQAKAEISGKLAELAFKRGDMDRAVQDYETALRLLGVFIPKSSFLLLLILIWQTVWQVLHTFFPRFFVHQLKRQPTEPERLILQLFSGLAHGCWYARSKAYALCAHLRGMNLAERYLPTPELAHVYSEHAPAMTLVPLLPRAVKYVEKSLEIHKLFGDLWGQGQSYHYYGVVLYADSNYSGCIEKCREGIRLLERMGDYWQVHIARYQVAASFYRLGDFQSALEEAKLNHKSGLELGDEQASGIILDVWARAAQGDIPEEILQRELERERHDAQGTGQVFLAQGICLLASEEPEQAAEVLQKAVDVVKQAGIKNAYSLPSLTWLAVVRRRQIEKLGAYSPETLRRLLRKAKRALRQAFRGSRINKNDLPQIFRESGLIAAMEGRKNKARRFFDRSLVLAREHQAEYEYAQSLLARGKLGLELGWPGAEAEAAEAQAALDKLLLAAAGQEKQGQAAEPVTLSLADRFDTVLKSGRKIASALSKQVIYGHAHDTALRLLRGERCLVLEIEQQGETQSFRRVAGETEAGFNSQMVQEALRIGQAVVCGENGTEEDSELVISTNEKSSICVPIYVRKRAAACLYVAHGQLQQLFGDDEKRLAGFIATLTGAALENAEGFEQLETLNKTLEQRVADRTKAAETRAHELGVSNRELERIADELRQTEDQLRIAIAEAESATRAKSQFLATMSHEIRTPMNGVLGMTELALRTSLSSQQRSYLNTVKQSGDALLTLLNDILDISKIEAGKMELENIHLWMRETVEGAVRALAVPAAQKGLRLCCRIAPDTSPVVIGDPNRLRQVIVNLVGNAIKFTEKGEIFIDVWTESKEQEVEQVHFSVKDTGIGIPPDKQQAIFESFQQSDSSTTRRFGGTGLGLTISAQITSIMGGRLWVESEEGQGSTFHFVIPFRAPDYMTFGNAITTALNKHRVLLVGNHATGNRIYRELLESFGVLVANATDRREAFEAVEHGATKREPFDLIILVVDETEDGHWNADLVEQLCNASPEGKCPVLALVPADHLAKSAAELPTSIENCLVAPPTTIELVEAILTRLKTFKNVADVSISEKPQESSVISLQVLLADDGPVNQDVAAGLLELRGHRVEIVDNGKEAVEAMEKMSFDVVLMDLEMPVMDGLEATRIIRQREASTQQHTPIIAMTAHVIKGFQQRCEEAGMDGYLNKPIQPDKLFEAIEAFSPQHPSKTPCK